MWPKTTHVLIVRGGVMEHGGNLAELPLVDTSNFSDIRQGG